MEYYAINDALAEGTLFKVRLKCNLDNKYLEKILKGRRIENNLLYLPYYMIECLLGTEYIEVVEVLDKKVEEHIEGSPEHCNLEDQQIYMLQSKLQNLPLLSSELKEQVREMHRKRTVKGTNQLSNDNEKYLDREEKQILRKGRAGWK
ncbi:hypothetical protein NEOKW01_1689 [Nematocida sp. AWRm80]|nr:hypothetical protein NEOKW01_1689 [Nematocida sp. AWRm80]